MPELIPGAGLEIRKNYGSKTKSFTIRNRINKAKNNKPKNVTKNTTLKNVIASRKKALNLAVGKKQAIKEAYEKVEKELKELRNEKRKALAKAKTLEERAQKLMKKSEEMVQLAQKIRSGEVNLTKLNSNQKNLLNSVGMSAQIEEYNKDKMDVDKELEKIEEKEEKISSELDELMGAFNKVLKL